MTKKVYEKIAKVIHGQKVRYMFDAQSQAVVYDLAEALANSLARDNPRFDRERFLKACGVS